MKSPLRRITWWRQRRQKDDELREELQFHLEMDAAEQRETGLEARDAAAAARRALGNELRVREDVRELWTWQWLDDLARDLRYVARTFRRERAVTLLSVVSLAVGIAACTTILSLMEAALWKPLPVRAPAELRLLSWTAGPHPAVQSTWDDWDRVAPNQGYSVGASFSYAAFQAFERDHQAFVRLFAFKPIGRVTTLVDGLAESAVADLVSGGMYDTLGVVPAAGRPLLPSDDRPGLTQTIATISDGYWTRRFGRDPTVVGRTIHVNQVAVTIVGVNPPGFNGPMPQSSPDLFLPLASQPVLQPYEYSTSGNLLDDPETWWVDMIGRLEPDVTDRQAHAILQPLLQDVVRSTLPDSGNRDQLQLRLLDGARGLDNLRENFGAPLRRHDPHLALRDGGRSMAGGSHTFRVRSLIVVQVSLSVLLSMAAALFIRTLTNLQSVELGFRPDGVLLFTVDPPRARYAKAARGRVFEEIDRKLQSIPGIETSSFSETVLVSGGNSRTTVAIDGITAPVATWVNTVGASFFSTMGIPILRGRSYDPQDDGHGLRVAVVNQQFAKKFLASGDPIGRRFTHHGETYEIVGICGDTQYNRARAAVPPTWFNLSTQADDTGAMTFAVRTALAGPAILPAIRAAVQAVDKGLTVYDVRTQRQQIESTMSHERLFGVLTGAFSVVALLLACAGIYGILAQSVSRRTGEIGVRLALGASRRNVAATVLGEAGVLAGCGVVAGILVALALGRYVRAILFGVSPMDPAIIAVATVATTVVALLAAYSPARRAWRIDPLTALRHE